MPKKPVNVKAMKLNPVERPRLSWRVPPSRKIITNGKTTAATSRPGSRANLRRSRDAIATTAFTSGLLLSQDPQIGVLESRRLGSQRGERLVESVDDLVRGA